MCGIIGYLGKRTALPIVLKCLEKLEYRGYDSCGVLIYDTKENRLILKKTVGIIKDLKNLFRETRMDANESTRMDANDRDIVYKELSYLISGLIYRVHNKLGSGQKETVYQNALEIEFEKSQIPYQKEQPIEVVYEDKKIGTYKPDFIIDDKILLEIKSVPFISSEHKRQLWHYLKNTKYKLGILVNFGTAKAQIYRIVYDKIRDDSCIDSREFDLNNPIRDNSRTDSRAFAHIGIGHTRWATHGGVTEFNAHPHYDCHKEIFVVHNGIIENYQTIKEKLIEKGHKFISETDTEVIPHLIEEFIKNGLDFESAVYQTLHLIKGTFALVIFNKNEPKKLIGARFASPLVLGIGKDEFILASDPIPVLLLTNDIIFLDDGEMVILNEDNYEFKSFHNNLKVDKEVTKIDLEVKEETKGGFEHYMIKEIFEEPIAVLNTLRGRILKNYSGTKISGLEMLDEKLNNLQRIILTGCGTAYYACLYGKYLFEEFLPYIVEAEIASELRYRKIKYDNKTLLIAISQSGETIDTLEVVKEAKNKRAITFGIINVPGSTIARTVNAGMYTYAGPEMAVASTKAFVSQMTALVLIMIYLAKKNFLKENEIEKILKELEKIAEKIERMLKNENLIISLANNLLNYKNFYFLGRKFSYPIALEGALKLKEISYVHSEAYPAGEMKHGPIALIDENFPVFVISPDDSVFNKTFSNLEEIKARNGRIILVTDKTDLNSEKVDFLIPIEKTLEIFYPLISVVPLHLFAYHFAKLLNLPIDRPRNLAKSVTVE